MKSLKAAELRKLYLGFFRSKSHAVIPSASLIPENDPTVLFTTAGMHPLIPYLLDVIGYLFVNETVDALTGETTETRMLLTRRDKEIVAGERVGGRLPKFVVDPNVDRMMSEVFPQRVTS